MEPVFAFACRVRGMFDGHETIVNARTAGRAKYEFWCNVEDAWPGLPFTLIRVRKVGAPVTTASHEHTCEHRHRPDLAAGARVRFARDGRTGTVVGSDSSANFRVLVDGERVPCHVHPVDLLPARAEVGKEE